MCVSQQRADALANDHVLLALGDVHSPIVSAIEFADRRNASHSVRLYVVPGTCELRTDATSLFTDEGNVTEVVTTLAMPPLVRHMRRATDQAAGRLANRSRPILRPSGGEEEQIILGLDASGKSARVAIPSGVILSTNTRELVLSQGASISLWGMLTIGSRQGNPDEESSEVTDREVKAPGIHHRF